MRSPNILSKQRTRQELGSRRAVQRAYCMSVRSDDGVEAEPLVEVQRRAGPRRVRAGATVRLLLARPLGGALPTTTPRRRRSCAARRRTTTPAVALRLGAPRVAGEALQRAGAHAGAEDVAGPRADEGHGQDPVHAAVLCPVAHCLGDGGRPTGRNGFCIGEHVRTYGTTTGESCDAHNCCRHIYIYL